MHLGLRGVQLLKSLMPQVFQLCIGMLELTLDLLFDLLVSFQNLILLVTLMPLGRPPDCLHSLCIVSELRDPVVGLHSLHDVVARLEHRVCLRFCGLHTQ